MNNIDNVISDIIERYMERGNLAVYRCACGGTAGQKVKDMRKETAITTVEPVEGKEQAYLKDSELSLKINYGSRNISVIVHN